LIDKQFGKRIGRTKKKGWCKSTNWYIWQIKCKNEESCKSIIDAFHNNPL